MPTSSAPLSCRRLLIGASAGLLLLPFAACSQGETVAVSPASAPVAPTDAPAAIAPTAPAAPLASASAPTASAAAPTAESTSSPEV
jgi:hypothetical protein